jgi:hypothetical protein
MEIAFRSQLFVSWKVQKREGSVGGGGDLLSIRVLLLAAAEDFP